MMFYIRQKTKTGRSLRTSSCFSLRFILCFVIPLERTLDPMVEAR